MEQAAGVSRLQRFGVRLNEDQLGVVLVSRVSSNDSLALFTIVGIISGKVIERSEFRYRYFLLLIQVTRLPCHSNQMARKQSSTETITLT